MNTKITLTNNGYGFFRWKLAEERMDWEERNGTFMSARWWKHVLSLVNLICMGFHADECEKELDTIVKEYIAGTFKKPDFPFPPSKADDMM